MAAPPEKREELLADLQKFAFMGIPDIRRTQPGQVNRLIVARNGAAKYTKDDIYHLLSTLKKIPFLLRGLTKRNEKIVYAVS
jgi:hypothetical protein